MSADDFAKFHNLDPGTIRRYKFENRLPPPDAVIGIEQGETAKAKRKHYGWLPETVTAWHRPGQGARTDLDDET